MGKIAILILIGIIPIIRPIPEKIALLYYLFLLFYIASHSTSCHDINLNPADGLRMPHETWNFRK